MAKGARVRFAPSPTGKLHAGNARTALYNWLYAKKNGGVFVLRIDDTDPKSSLPRFEKGIIEELRWLNLNWDEGPDVGGPFAPYRQSERLEIYASYAARLLAEGKAYKCFCSEEELEQRRKEMIARALPSKYDGRCRALKKEDIDRLEKSGRRAAVRLMVGGGEIEFDDIIRGKVSFQASDIGDFVILKSDGTPAYNFAAVVDDSLMEITHIIRGEDHISNTPRQLIIYRALGLKEPIFAHLSLIVAQDRSPLAKRGGSFSIEELKKAGFLSEALVHYMANAGFGLEGGNSTLAIDDLVRQFDLNKAARAPAVFDSTRLAFLNSQYIKARDDEKLALEIEPYLREAGYDIDSRPRAWIRELAKVLKGEIKTLRDAADASSFLFGGPINFLPETAEILRRPESLAVLSALKGELENFEVKDSADYWQLVELLKRKVKNRGKALFMPIRAAITGRTKGPELERLLPLVEKKIVLDRLSFILSGGLSAQFDPAAVRAKIVK